MRTPIPYIDGGPGFAKPSSVNLVNVHVNVSLRGPGFSHPPSLLDGFANGPPPMVMREYSSGYRLLGSVVSLGRGRP